MARIVDTLTYVWESPEQLGRRAAAHRPRDAEGDRVLHADPLEHYEAIAPADAALVLAFQSRLLEARVPNELVADYVRSHPDRLVGIASIDPLAPGANDELERAVDRLGLRGVAISPSAQGFHPMHTRAVAVYQRLCDLRLPLIVHRSPCPAPRARLEYAQPVLLDEVVREFPELTVLIGSLGGPFVEQTFALLAKHANVWANLAGMLTRPWQAYNVLLAAQQADVIGRLLFASGFPFANAAGCIESIYSINQLVSGTSLPTIPRELLRGIVERDALSLLGLASRAVSAPAAPADASDAPPASAQPSGDVEAAAPAPSSADRPGEP